MLTKLNKFQAAALMLTALLLGFGAASVKAAPTVRPGITVTPFLQNVQIGSEASKSFDITYANDSNQTKKLALSIADFGSLDQTGGVAFVGSEFNQLLDKYTLSRWLSLSENSFTLSPHQKTSITATVANDSAIGPGGHYAAVVATVLAADGSGKTQVSLKQKISSLVFAIKTGGEKYDLKLEKIDGNASLFRLPTMAYITIRATGNVHVVPRGIVYLKNSSGKVISRGVINQESGFVLPDTTRIFTVQLNKLASAKLWDTSYTLQADYRYDGLAIYASKKTSLRYLSPSLVLFTLFMVILAVAIGRYKTEVKSKLASFKKKRH